MLFISVQNMTGWFCISRMVWASCVSSLWLPKRSWPCYSAHNNSEFLSWNKPLLPAPLSQGPATATYHFLSCKLLFWVSAEPAQSSTLQSEFFIVNLNPRTTICCQLSSVGEPTLSNLPLKIGGNPARRRHILIPALGGRAAGGSLGARGQPDLAYKWVGQLGLLRETLSPKKINK